MTGMYLVALACMVIQLIHGLDAAIILDDDHIQLSWLKFKAEHNRNYDEAEDAVRKATFENNLKFIIQHNLAYDRGEVTYTVGITSRADMRYSDCAMTPKRKSGFNDEPRSGEESRLDRNPRFDGERLNNRSLKFESKLGKCGCLPSLCKPGIDYVAKKKTPAIQHQGNCGSCYSFGAVTAITAALAIKNNVNKPDWLSVQQGLDCSYKIHVYPNDFMNKGCDGGYPGYVYDGLRTAGGITLWANYPYVHKYNKRCDRSKPIIAKLAATYKEYHFWRQLTINTTYINQTMIDDIECKIEEELQYGPVTVSVCDDQSFINFKSTKKTMVYDNKNCAQNCRQERLNLPVPENLEIPVTHTVTIVGYTNKYWLIQNSWGVGWGYKGYMRMARGIGVCDVGLQITRPVLV